MNEKTLWKKFLAAGMTIAGAAGLMGNLYAESALNPKNLQQTYEKSQAIQMIPILLLSIPENIQTLSVTVPAMGWHSGRSGHANRLC